MSAAAPSQSVHPFDDALQLERIGDDRFGGRTSAAYWNMIGPFGGITAAVMLRAVMDHPDRLGDPVSLTVNFAGPIAEGPFEVEARPSRTNRSTQHWTLALLQNGEITTTATAVFAIRRDTWGSGEATMPEAPPPEASDPLPSGFAPVNWFKSYEMRPVRGAKPPADAQGENPDSLTQFWLRDQPPRTPDYCSVTAWCDSFYPRIFLKRPGFVPAGTVSMTVYYHADAATLATLGDGFMLGSARAQVFRQGFFDQTAQLWSPGGELVASSHQIVYYKQ